MSQELAPRERVDVIRAQIAEEGGVAALTSTAQAQADGIHVSLSSDDGKISLYWHNYGPIGSYDYVALYDKFPDDPYGYLRLQWDYVRGSPGSRYITGTDAKGDKDYWIAYVTYDYEHRNYVILKTAGPSRP